jgi:dihydrofolate reductase
MGRRTFESLPKGALPNRRNVVISSLLTQPKDNSFFVKKTIKAALSFCKNDEKVFVIGGESIYRQTIEMADTLHITHIHADFTADTFFPEINTEEWKEKSRQSFYPDEKNRFSYSFVDYERKN